MAEKTSKKAAITLGDIFPNYNDANTRPLSGDELEFKVQAEPKSYMGTATIVLYIHRDAATDRLDEAFGGMWSKTTPPPYQMNYWKKEYNQDERLTETWGWFCTIDVKHPETGAVLISRDGHSDSDGNPELTIKGGDSNAFKRAAAQLLQCVRELRNMPKFAVQCEDVKGKLKAPAMWKILPALKKAMEMYEAGMIDKNDIYIGIDGSQNAATYPNEEGYGIWHKGQFLWSIAAEKEAARIEAEEAEKSDIVKKASEAKTADEFKTVVTKEVRTKYPALVKDKLTPLFNSLKAKFGWE